jgi:hypothetical protein
VNDDAYDFMLSFSKILKTHTLRTHTLIERKSRMPQIQGVKGEAIVSYAEPLTTQACPAELSREAEDAVSSAFPEGKQNEDLEEKS